MNELALMRLTGGLGAGVDTVALIAFIAFAAVYFLAPRVTNTTERPTALVMALYLMIGYAAISLGQLLMQWAEVLNADGGFIMPQRGMMAVHVMFGFSALKTAVLVIAMIAFVAGLQMLRFKDAETRAFEQAVEKLQQLRDENVRLRKRLEQDAHQGDEGT